MKLRLCMILVSLTLFLGMANAQTVVSGTVTSAEDGEPLIGASVMIKGTKVGTTTDFDGNFSITTQVSNPQIVVSFIGMETATLKGGRNMKVVLNPDKAQQIGEVIVTGMQKMDKRLFTGAATKVDAEKAKLDGVSDISRSLEGRAAGVSVQNVSGTFGTAPKIRVRGATSIYGSSKPLWVVDGVIMEDVTEVDADALSSGDAATVISNAIAGLNADDIASFDILKDGSATSIYGARAMAGVIVVTTKRGKAGSSRISYTGEFTMRMKPNYSQFNIMNSQEQMSVYREMMKSGFFSFTSAFRASNSGVFGKMYHLMNTLDPSTGQFLLANTPEAMASYLRQAEYRNTDWFDQLFSNSIQMNHSISMSGGSDKAQYYTSFSMLDDPGWTKKSRVQRYTANINASYNLNNKVTMNMIGNASYRKQQSPGTTNRATDVVNGVVSRDFDINPYSYSLNSSRTLDPNEFYVRSYAPFNIFNELNNNYMNYDVVDMKFQAELKYKPISKVELSVLGAYKFSTTTQSHSITEKSNQAIAFRMMDDATMRDANPWLYLDPDVPNSLRQTVLPKGGFYRETKYKMNSWDFRATASYNDVFNDRHILNLYGGMEVNNVKRNRSYFNGVGMQFGMGLLGSYDYKYFKQASEENSIYYSLNNGYSREASFFGTATYSWKGRYTVNGTARYEGSNRLGKARSARWLPTWNLSGAWNAHEEPWFSKLNPYLTHATLKTSYSLTGDKPAITNAEVIISSYNPWRPFSDDRESGLDVDDFANPNLTYEKKHEFNLGLDLGFLNNRLNLELAYYKRNNYDLIGPKRTTGIEGGVIKYANVASMSSSGFEFTLSSRNIVKKDFTWSTDFIFSHNTSKVTSLDSRTRIIDMLGGSGFTGEGYPYRALFSMDFRGLDNKGLPTFINQDGELVTSDTGYKSLDFQSYNLSRLIYNGPVDPTITGSLGNVFTYKGLTLNVFITYAAGNKVRLDPTFGLGYSDLTAMPKEFKNRLTVPGDEAKTDIPAIADFRQMQSDPYLSRAYSAYNYSQNRVAKGDFVRMKEISLGYEVPQAFARHLGLSSASLKLQGTNLFLIYSDKKLYGQDPEFANSGGVAVPMARQFTFTVRLGI